MEEQLKGQINFADYFKPAIKEKPKSLVDFINGMGRSQYNQIGDVISEICESNNYDMPEDSIGRITNSVSVWLLRIGEEYGKYLEEMINMAD